MLRSISTAFRTSEGLGWAVGDEYYPGLKASDKLVRNDTVKPKAEEQP